MSSCLQITMVLLALSSFNYKLSPVIDIFIIQETHNLLPVGHVVQQPLGGYYPGHPAMYKSLQLSNDRARVEHGISSIC